MAGCSPWESRPAPAGRLRSRTPTSPCGALGIILGGQPPALLIAFSFWFILVGIGDVVEAMEATDNRGWMGLLGVVTIVAGMIILANPDIGLTTSPSSWASGSSSGGRSRSWWASRSAARAAQRRSLDTWSRDRSGYGSPTLTRSVSSTSAQSG